MPSERDKASENPCEASRFIATQHSTASKTPSEKSLAGSHTSLRVIFLTSLPAIVVAAVSPVTAFFLWPYDTGYVAVMTVVMNPITLVSWLTIACGIGWFMASKKRANIFNTLAVIAFVHLACLAVTFFSLGMATLSAM